MRRILALGILEREGFRGLQGILEVQQDWKVEWSADDPGTERAGAADLLLVGLAGEQDPGLDAARACAHRLGVPLLTAVAGPLPRGTLWLGADVADFLVAPFSADEVRARLARALLRRDAPPDRSAPAVFRLAKARAVAEFERGYALKLLAATGGNVTRAAQMARKERRAFGKLIKKHGIDRHTFASARPAASRPNPPPGRA